MHPLLKYTLIILGASLLFFPFLGGVHLFDWDEINFAECAREMIVSKDYLRAQIDFMPFWEKPPFFIWMQVLSMKLFGVGAFAARFPNAMVGVITLSTLYYAGKKVVNETIGVIWVLLYAASWLPHFYFKTGIIDPTFNLFIFLAFFQMWLIPNTHSKLLHSALAGLSLGMAVLTKGPVALIIAALSFGVYVILNKGFGKYRFKELLIIMLCAIVPMVIWLGSAVLNYGLVYGKWFLGEFLAYQVRLFSTEDSDHGGPFIYHFIVLLIGCFPASVFLFQYSRKNKLVTNNPLFTRWMTILFWVVLILFSIVKTKIVHYSSLCYFPLTWLAALQVYRLLKGEAHMKKGVKIMLISLCAIWAIVLIALPIVGINKQILIPYIEDPFAVGNLQADVSWSYFECAYGLLYLIAVCVAVIIMNTNFRKGAIVFCTIQIVMIQMVICLFTRRIEAYSQRAAIDFYSGNRGKDVYVHTLGFKSYAYLFYTRKNNTNNPSYCLLNSHDSATSKERPPQVNEAWLLNGNTDKPVYFVCKVQDKNKYATLQQLEMLYEKNGFVFFRRR